MISTRRSSGSTVVAVKEDQFEPFLNETADASVLEISRGMYAVQAIVFLICGTSQLFYWNALLNMIADITSNYYPETPNLSDTLTAVYNSLNLVGALLITWRGSLNFKINIVGGVLLFGAHILTAVIVQTCKGTTGVVLLHLIASVAGFACGIYQSGHYALAASMPTVCSGWVSQGNGICGILTFALWILFSEVVFEKKILSSLWWTMGIGAFCSVVSTAAVLLLSRREDVERKVADMKARVIQEKNDPNRPSYLQIFRQIWPYTIGLFLNFFITLLIFPALGPLRWHTGGSTQTNVIMGMFQVGDFVGRGLPQLASLLPFILLPPMVTHVGIGLRSVFILIFVLLWKLTGDGASNFGLQVVMMLLMAVTSGWFGTCEMIHAPSAIENEAYRARAGAINIVGLLTGIVVGLWVAKLVVIGS